MAKIFNVKLTEHEIFMIERAIDQSMYLLPPNSNTYKEYEKLDKQMFKLRCSNTSPNQVEISEREDKDLSIIKRFEIECVEKGVVLRDLNEAVNFCREIRPNNLSTNGVFQYYIVECLLGRNTTAYHLHWKLVKKSDHNNYYYKTPIR